MHPKKEPTVIYATKNWTNAPSVYTTKRYISTKRVNVISVIRDTQISTNSTDILATHMDMIKRKLNRG